MIGTRTTAAVTSNFVVKANNTSTFKRKWRPLETHHRLCKRCVNLFGLDKVKRYDWRGGSF